MKPNVRMWLLFICIGFNFSCRQDNQLLTSIAPQPSATQNTTSGNKINSALNRSESVPYSVEIKLNERDDAFFKALAAGDENKIADLLKQGVSPDVKKWIWIKSGQQLIGTTALCEAVKIKNIGIVKILLRAGADVNLCSVTAEAKGEEPPTEKTVEEAAAGKIQETSSPLFVAAQSDAPAMLYFLAENRADVKKAGDGRSMYNLTFEEETIKALKHIEADINQIDNTGGPDTMTPLMEAVRFDYYDKIRLLIKYGADVNARNSEGCNVWGFLAEDKNEQISKLLKKSGAKNRNRQCLDQ